MNSDKRILVVSHNSFSKVLNNGKTLESMFREYPKDNLAQVFFSENEYPDFDFCKNYFKITDIDVLSSLLMKKSKCGGIVAGNEIADNTPNTEAKPKLSKLFNIIKSKASYLKLFRDILWCFNSWKKKPFLDWCKAYNPDLVFYVGGDMGFSHNIALFLSKELSAPLVVYFTDDYLIYPKNRNLIDSLQKIRMRKFYKRTVNHSSLCFAIGELMAAEYTRYFNKEFLSIMNSVEKQNYITYTEKQPVNLSYFGGLHLNRWKMLVRLAKVLSRGAINVYSMQHLSKKIIDEFNNVGIKFKGGIEGTDLQNAILNSDILLHVESDDIYNKSLTKLSVSTKIPEYLMSGRLIVGFGPEEVASMRILSDNEIGIVLSSAITEENLSFELNKIISDFEFRKKMGLLAFNYATKNFDNTSISKNFKKKLESIN